MSLLHSRCLSIEAMLRGRVSDLEQLVADVQDKANQDRERWMQRERDLLDRLIVAVNPVAARALSELYARDNRSDKPAAPPPSIERERLARAPLPRGSANIPINRSRVGPVLTPESSGFRPSAESAGRAEATESEETAG